MKDETGSEDHFRQSDLQRGLEMMIRGQMLELYRLSEDLNKLLLFVGQEKGDRHQYDFGFSDTRALLRHYIYKYSACNGLHYYASAYPRPFKKHSQT